MSFDPWCSATDHATSGRKKMARLVGKSAGRVHTLVKLHDWSGRAIYVYNLITEEMRHLPMPSDKQWTDFRQAGIEISHPGRIQATDVAAWVAYARQEARRLNLQIGE